MVNQLKLARCFHHQARWLNDRFTEEKLPDVEGFIIAAADKRRN